MEEEQSNERETAVEVGDTEMPRDVKRARRGETLLNSSDLTLQHFADSPRPQSSCRVKKSVVGASAPIGLSKAPSSGQASGQAIVQQDKEDLSWFEKDLEDFGIEDTLEEEEEEDLAFPRTYKKNEPSGLSSDKTGVQWPADLWYLLSHYVHPEDIGRFARLCRGSYAVTTLAGFWRRLYHRHYFVGPDGPPHLPNHVKPSSIEILHGLRAKVIRSLFLLYPPLVERAAFKGPMEDEPHQLKGQRCLLAWHQPHATKGWVFCFKFQKPSFQAWTSRPCSKQDVYNGYNDLFYHPDEGCSVLQVTCIHFSSAAAVMGLLLTQVYVTLSSGMRHHKLRLHFDTTIKAGASNSSDQMVVLDNVLAFKVLPWWHPLYPFTS